jgi:UTP--glucose-1-phosphate uridylyltransferase
MTGLYEQYGASILGVERIAPEQSSAYGVVPGTQMCNGLHTLQDIVEKPAPENALSNLGVVGRYILTPAIFKHLHAAGAGAGGEIQLMDAIASLIADEPVLAYKFEGTRYDCGSNLGYLHAAVKLALKHSGLKEEFERFLSSCSRSQKAYIGASYQKREEINLSAVLPL